MGRSLVALICAVSLLAVAVSAGVAEEPSSAAVGSPVDFSRDVYPVLRRACFECHGAAEQEAGLRLDIRDEVMASGMLEPGDPEASELLRRITLPRGEEGVMPAVGEPLPAAQIESIRRWIAQGAEWPTDFQPAGHWSYIPPRRPELPPVSEPAWARSPIDRFVMQRLDAAGLSPSPAAAPEKLVRRLYLDLTGLPPSPQEVEAFVTDPSEPHLVRLVDELLSRPQFGERWARPWLDLARYADSHGFQRDNLREIWAYRDWVIRALNADMPFDQFTIEQLAGDLLPEASEAQRIATGFHRCAPTNVEAGSLPEETRTEQLIDRVNTTGAVWLGTTLECCQCHDHKYDPFTMKDYYRLLAFFNSTEREADRTNPKKPSSIQFQGPSMPLSNPQRDAQRVAVKAEIEQLRGLRTERRRELAKDLEAWAASWQASPEALSKIVAKPAEEWTKAQRKKLLDARLGEDPRARSLDQQIQKLEKRAAQLAPDTTLVMIELEEPRPTRIFQRGDYRQPGEHVQPGTPAALPAGAPGAGNRLTLARWLVSPQNPLVARVTVNRWWAELFGRGIVPTLEDFGVKGDPPSHPELLDWLAVEFMENGWSRKRLLKEIVLSSTYRQSSHVDAALLRRDPENRLLARGPNFRMDAEMIRDNALAISGLLDRQFFGPPIRPYQPDGIWSKVGGTAYEYQVSEGGGQYRRGVYVVLKRGSPYPSFVNFDATARLACTVKRSRTNTPLQALTLLNDPVYVRAAEALAERIERERGGASLDEQLDYAFQLCTGRIPGERERRLLRRLHQEQRGWQSVATVLLNLHETITKD